MQAPDAHPHLTLFLTLWAVIAPLVALAVGSFFQAFVQRRQWRRDQRREECKQLLSQMTVTSFAIHDWKFHVNGSVQTCNDSIMEFQRILGSSLFIANEIQSAHINKRWSEATEKL